MRYIRNTTKNAYMKTNKLVVVSDFDPNKKYGIKINPKERKFLSFLNKGQRFEPKEFLEQHYNELATPNSSRKSKQDSVYNVLGIAKQIGLVKREFQRPISFVDFCKLETVQYYKNQLRHDRRKNIRENAYNLSATQKSYLYEIWNLNNWLVGREFESNRLVQTDTDSYKKIKMSTKLEGLEHFFKLYTESFGSESDFVKMIKQYLHDETLHANKKAQSMIISRCAIVGYFEKNDSPIVFKFNAKARYQPTNSEEEQPKLSLEDLLKMLTVGKPSITQKAVILCKFHRGLDASTLCDRLNFQAWEQLVEYFGTDQHEKWDLSKCPVPIKLTRIKTDFTHLGFLDIDAVQAIKDYLNFRYKKTGDTMKVGEPLFINSLKRPILDQWVRASFKKLANTSGLQRKLKRNGIKQLYEKETHELRDLLKSTLIDCGTRIDVADHCVGHKPKDTYEKQAILYPASVRAEFMKASTRLNIFSNISHYMNGDEEKESLRRQVESLKDELKNKSQSQDQRLAEYELNQQKILAWIERDKQNQIQQSTPQ